MPGGQGPSHVAGLAKVTARGRNPGEEKGSGWREVGEGTFQRAGEAGRTPREARGGCTGENTPRPCTWNMLQRGWEGELRVTRQAVRAEWCGPLLQLLFQEHRKHVKGVQPQRAVVCGRSHALTLL